MGQYVQRMVAEDARVRVHIEYLHPDRVYEKVLEGSADLGLVSYPRRSPKLAALAWREENMVLVCPNHHAAIHCDDAAFDYADTAFGFSNGLRESLQVNRHLPAA